MRGPARRSAPGGARSGAPAALGALALALLAGRAGAATAEGHLRAGNKLYDKGEFEGALERYQSAGRRSRDHRAVFNAGAALYRLERGDDAAAAFESASGDPTAPTQARADALYNLGNTRAQGGDYAGAAAAYRGSLTLDPSDEQARHNLAVALKLQANPPPQQQKKDKPQPQQDKPKDKDEKGGGQDESKPKAPPQTRNRPQDQLTKDEAERVMRAVGEREKQARQALEQARRLHADEKPPTGEDW